MDNVPPTQIQFEKWIVESTTKREPKFRRRANACISCRQKKVQCKVDNQTSKCLRCQKDKIECRRTTYQKSWCQSSIRSQISTAGAAAQSSAVGTEIAEQGFVQSNLGPLETPVFVDTTSDTLPPPCEHSFPDYGSWYSELFPDIASHEDLIGQIEHSEDLLAALIGEDSPPNQSPSGFQGHPHSLGNTVSMTDSENVHSVNGTARWEARDYGGKMFHYRIKGSSGRDAYIGPPLVFMSSTEISEMCRTHNQGPLPVTKKLITLLETWDPEHTATKQINKHRYDNNVLPSYDKAVTLAEAYFEYIQCLFPIIDYPSFMNRLKATYPTISESDDPAWCSLVNSVLALGLRCSSQQDNVENQIEESQFCGLFLNAMSFLPALLIESLTIYGIQAFAVMYLFAHCSAIPQCAYMLLSSGIRLAQAGGLHIQPCKAWRLTADQIRERNLLFWSLFCFDIHTSYFTGRPPLINLSDVNLPLPHTLGGSATKDFPVTRSRAGFELKYEDDLHELFLKLIETCKLLQKVYEWTRHDLYNDSVLAVALQLEAELTVLHMSMRPGWQLCNGSTTMDMSDLQPQLLPSLVHIHYLILNARWVLSARIDMLRPGETNSFLGQVISNGYRAASSAILLIQSLPSDIMPSSWIFTQCPMYAFWVLFKAVINHPNAQASGDNLSLMSSVIENTAQSSSLGTFFLGKNLAEVMMLYCRVARLEVRRAKVASGISSSGGYIC